MSAQVVVRLGEKARVRIPFHWDNRQRLKSVLPANSRLKWNKHGLYWEIARGNWRGLVEQLSEEMDVEVWVESKGRLNPTVVCDLRCIAAKGDDCVCSCAGSNHKGAFQEGWMLVEDCCLEVGEEYVYTKHWVVAQKK